jgi:solute carrier family 25 (peroxisomal adenine nucleotide transporter), member 17
MSYSKRVIFAAANIAMCPSVYYYFYERTRAGILRSGVNRKGLSTLESMLAGLLAGM